MINNTVEIVNTLKDYEVVKDLLTVRPYPVGAPGVEDSIHKVVGDIALVLYVVLQEDEGVLVGAKIPRKLGEVWGIPSGTLMEEAFQNVSEPRILDFATLTPDGMDGIPLDEYEGSFSYICLTTAAKINGAVAVFLPGVAKRIAETLDSDLYLVFTSVHETMIHPVGEIEKKVLQEVMRNTIETATTKNDVLTHNIYRYFRKNDEIRMV